MSADAQNIEIDEDVVNIENVSTTSEKGIDYEKLLVKFGCFPLTAELKEKMEKLTNMKLHRFLRRGIFFCHRDLDLILNSYEQKKPFFLYTGRGPSDQDLHLGHAIPFIFTKYLQDAFDVPLVI